MNSSVYFSENYHVAKDRFCQAATDLGAVLTSYPIDGSPNLTIDVAVLGEAVAQNATIITSGLHGVEGYFGSAAQLAWLSTAAPLSMLQQNRIVLVHAMNPFGFANNRRVNENNIDLNRNFLTDPANYNGSPEAYGNLNQLLNPTSAPSRWEPFTAKALWTIARMGLPQVKQAVAGGQYDYPKGLFFGGQQQSHSASVFQQNLHSWIGGANNVIHADLHTGLGKRGRYKLLLSDPTPDEWYARTFGADFVEAPSTGEGTAYDSSGSLGQWCLSVFPDLNYRYVLAEFGTYGVIRVLSALRAENRAHFYCQPNDPRQATAKANLMECFCPASKSWRTAILQKALTVFQQATSASWSETEGEETE